MTRELWLTEAVELMRDWFTDHGKPLPEKVRVSVGYGKRSGKAIGVCYRSHASEDGVNQIFVSPELHEPVEVLATLVHELVHAADNGENGHKGEFARVAKGLGLEGKMTSTHAGLELTGKLATLADKLGQYEHSKLNPAELTAKQTTRMIKIEAKCCGFIARASRKALAIGMPSCACGNEMGLG